MATVYCDKCHFEWPVDSIVFEEIILNEQSGTKMRFYQCPECGEEYIVDITDTELRRLISVFKKMKSKYIKMYNAKASETKLRNYGERLQNVQLEIRERERELRRKWTRGE